MENVITTSETQVLARLDQMAMEIEQLRQQVLEQVRSRQRQRVKPIEEYEFYGMWRERPEWEGLTTEDVVARIREQAWGRPDLYARQPGAPDE